MLFVSEGEFLDTNIMFDAIYSTRPLNNKFLQTFSTTYLLKKLAITVSVDTEAQIIATESVNFLVKAIYNTIRPIDWDNLTSTKKDEIIKEIGKNLETDEEVRTANRVTFVQDALKAITSQLQNLTKNEIVSTLCPHFHYFYTREMQRQIFEHFIIPPVDGSHPSHKNLLDMIKAANRSCNAFIMKENQDFDILSDLALLIAVGARYSNNLTQNFDTINFYSRDKKFEDNFTELKSHFNGNSHKNSEETIVDAALKNINMDKPY